ncbi:hypothetical protein DPMN_039122 [Dreissena polymorpha]|uniref:Uncharacterized protein n=1 Tax=Dreissena polymorpha TaxID=45954 RepID=A0A9D4ME11_DREPO|nr:hypothetical protein DPMN_039122 [Dreissena polymorpha]
MWRGFRRKLYSKACIMRAVSAYSVRVSIGTLMELFVHRLLSMATASMKWTLLFVPQRYWCHPLAAINYLFQIIAVHDDI